MSTKWVIALTDSGYAVQSSELCTLCQKPRVLAVASGDGAEKAALDMCAAENRQAVDPWRVTGAAGVGCGCPNRGAALVLPMGADDDVRPNEERLCSLGFSQCGLRGRVFIYRAELEVPVAVELHPFEPASLIVSNCLLCTDVRMGRIRQVLDALKKDGPNA